MELGNKLIQLRTARGLSQELLSRELEISKTALRKWEMNESKPSIDNLMRICDYFETDVYTLLEDVSNVDFSHAKFEGTNYVVNPNNTTINFNDNKELTKLFLENQEKMSVLVVQQQELLGKLLGKEG